MLEREHLRRVGYQRAPVQLHHVRRLHVSQVTVRLGVVPQLGAGDGREVTGVRLRDRHAVVLEEPLRAVEALGRQLVIPERSEQLGHQHVRLLRRIRTAHVAPYHAHVAPPLRGNQRLERDDGVGVLLHRVHPQSPAAPRRRPQGRSDEGTAARANHHEHRLLPSRRVVVAHPVLEARQDRLLVARVLGRVLLERLVRGALQVVHQRLERRLEVVPVPSLHELLLRRVRDLAEQVDEVLPPAPSRVPSVAALVPRRRLRRRLRGRGLDPR
mmetsp:Transcript_4198/g.15604  ORF Transcript_4198/g.15604 Transcript_4198/m.15604 type:complete len:270 (-) Transcript_4198:998-1807(-)